MIRADQILDSGQRIACRVAARTRTGREIDCHACGRCRIGDTIGSGIADQLLASMEDAARDEGARPVIIHTGDRQHAALKFYDRHGYTPIPVYPPYEDVTYSLCFEKLL